MLIHLEPFLNHIPVWLLVLFRLTGIFIFAPLLGTRTIPGRAKIFFALALSFCIYPILLSTNSTSAVLLTPFIDANFSLWSLVGAVALELTIGLVIGYGASLPLIGVQLGGRMMDQQMGLGLAGVINPEFDETTGIVSEFYFFLAMAIFTLLGGHRVMLMILVNSFNSIPLGGFVADYQLISMLSGILSITYQLALGVAAPMLCLICLETLATGFIARTVPQMNILSIGFAIRILIGVVLLIGVVGVQAEVFIEAMKQVLNILEGYFLS